MANTPERIESNQIEQIRLGGTTYDIIVKKDWATNDDTAVSYIANRTHFARETHGETLDPITHEFSNGYYRNDATNGYEYNYFDIWRPAVSWIYPGGIYTCTITEFNTTSSFDVELPGLTEGTGYKPVRQDSKLKYNPATNSFKVEGEACSSKTLRTELFTVTLAAKSDLNYKVVKYLDLKYLPLDHKSISVNTEGQLTNLDAIYTDDFSVKQQFGKYAPGAIIPAKGKSIKDVLTDAFGHETSFSNRPVIIFNGSDTSENLINTADKASACVGQIITAINDSQVSSYILLPNNKFEKLAYESSVTEAIETATADAKKEVADTAAENLEAAKAELQDAIDKKADTATLNEKVEELNTTDGELQGQIDSLSDTSETHTTELASVKSRLDTAEPKLATAEENISTLESGLSTTNSNLKNESTARVNKDTELANQLSALSGTVDQLFEAIDNANSGSAEGISNEGSTRAAADQKLLTFINQLDLSNVIKTTEVGDGNLCLAISFDKLVGDPKKL